ncbi:PKD domain-containing protein [Actinospica durhamensis]|uniref:PKD domain-containing protein n=1 Tax=Actinospica durhamensis TaxID=1508375 RepID=A0A941ET45_9ACTN|nr:PKD domain-containing protein [Actinospica durhamensis]MBR7833359.1 PKD domain-containing protein [Actinospica durhamensis]
MRSRVLAVSTATVLAAASLAPLEAQADGQNTIYVSNSAASGCTDSGSGTADAPYCTLQAAADVANPGDIVRVGPGTYAAPTLTRSGTASAPIQFVAVQGSAQTGTNVHVQGLTLDGASDIEFDDLALGNAVGTVTVSGGSNVTFAHDIIQGPPVTGSSGLHVTGAASDVTVQDSRLDSVLIDAGSTGTMLTTNIIASDYASPVSLVGAQSTDVTSNQISGCGSAISVTGASGGTNIENNNVSLDASQSSCPSSAGGYGMVVDSGSAAGTVSDYNDVYSSAGYEWGGNVYGTASSLDAATGQGRHDFNTVQSTTVADGSPMIDSADSDAPGEQSTDYYGNPRVSDPTVAHTGAGSYDYYDRGAVEFQDPHTTLTGSTFTASAGQAPIGATVALHTNYADTWSDSPTYEYSFYGPNGSSTVTTTATDMSLALPTAGTYTVDLAVNYNGYGYVSVSSLTVYAVAAAPLTPSLAVKADQSTMVDADPSGITDAWSIASVSLDFGDGTPAVSDDDGEVVSHIYAASGTYTITETVTDSGGNTAKTTTKFTTVGSDYTAYGPTRILDTRHGIGAAQAKVSTGGHVVLKIAGNGSIPAGVTAVALNLTVTDATGANGYVSAEPDGTAATKSSNINYLKGQTVTNYAIVPVAADGKIDVYDVSTAAGSVDLIADVSGYFRQSAGSRYTAVTPGRILDTRHGTGAPSAKVAPNHGLSVAVSGKDAIPAGVKAVALHVTVTDASANGWIAAEPDGAGTPSTSILNFLKGQTVSNTVIVPVAKDGKVELYNGGGSGSVDLIADVAGYFAPGPVGEYSEAYVPITPYRALDTRKAGGMLQADHTNSYFLSAYETQNIPMDATLVTNLTLTEETANGYITAYQSYTSQPSVSSLNYLKDQTVSGLDILATNGTQQQVSVYNQSAGKADLISDVFGYFSY